MGPEIIYPLVWAFSIASIAWLLIRLLIRGARLYALSTLLLSGVISLAWTWVHHEPGYFFKYALWCFAPVVIAVGLTVHLIHFAIKRRNSNSAP